MTEEDGIEWLFEILSDIQLQQFLPQIRDDLQITRIDHFDFVKAEDLEKIGLSKPVLSDSEEDVDQNLERSVKIAIVGEPNVGKTGIIRRFCYDDFLRVYQGTIGADFHIKRLTLADNRNITLRITDIGGLELRGTMLDKYLFNCDLIILVYDITNPASFDYMKHWMHNISAILTEPPFVAIIGNKCDLEHQRGVRLDHTRQFSNENEILSYIVSAKTGENVSNTFFDIVARHLGLPLKFFEKGRTPAVIKAELIMPQRIYGQSQQKINVKRVKTTACILQ